MDSYMMYTAVIGATGQRSSANIINASLKSFQDTQAKSRRQAVPA